MKKDPMADMRPWCESCGREGQELTCIWNLLQPGSAAMLCPRCETELKQWLLGDGPRPDLGQEGART